MKDQAILERVLARRSEPATTPWAKARAVRDALANHDDIDDVLDELDVTIAPTQELAEILAPPTQVTKLPEVHDPAGEVLPFHVPSGRASQVLGSVAIDPARMPSELDPTLTDSKRRTLRVEHQVARARVRDAGVSEIDELIQASKFAKDAATWGARIHVTVRVSR